MPELPEVEITARRIEEATRGATVESVLAPGMNVMKTFDPPLEALVGREITGVRRISKMPVIEFGDLSLLIHLMSAGRLRVFDKRASLKDRASRVLIRLDDGRELRLREFGHQAAGLGEAAARGRGRRGRDGGDARAGSVAGAAARGVRRGDRQAAPPPPPPAPPERHRGIGRSWVDEILWEARLSPFKKGTELDQEEVERLHAALHVLGDAIDHYEETIGPDLPDKIPMPLRIHKREGEPCPRCGTTIEAVFFSEHQMNYCPHDQTGDRILKDRRLCRNS